MYEYTTGNRPPKPFVIFTELKTLVVGAEITKAAEMKSLHPQGGVVEPLKSETPPSGTMRNPALLHWYEQDAGEDGQVVETKVPVIFVAEPPITMSDNR